MKLARTAFGVLDPLLGWPLMWLANRRARGVVLLYHRVSSDEGPDYPPLDPGVFREHLDLLSGLFPKHSEDLRAIERFTRTDDDNILYEFEIHDPRTYSEVWGGQVPWRKYDQQIFEYACHEGNYALANVLSGARSGSLGSDPVSIWYRCPPSISSTCACV